MTTPAAAVMTTLSLFFQQTVNEKDWNKIRSIAAIFKIDGISGTPKRPGRPRGSANKRKQPRIESDECARVVSLDEDLDAPQVSAGHISAGKVGGISDQNEGRPGIEPGTCHRDPRLGATTSDRTATVVNQSYRVPVQNTTSAESSTFRMGPVICAHQDPGCPGGCGEHRPLSTSEVVGRPIESFFDRQLHN